MYVLACVRVPASLKHGCGCVSMRARVRANLCMRVRVCAYECAGACVRVPVRACCLYGASALSCFAQIRDDVRQRQQEMDRRTTKPEEAN